MTIDPLSTQADFAVSADLPRSAENADFAQAMRAAKAAAAGGRPGELRDAAEKLVATAFIMPLLEQMRASAKASDLFHGGTGEDLFGHQLDTQLADRIIGSSRMPLIDAIEQQFVRAAGLDAGGKVDLHG